MIRQSVSQWFKGVQARVFGKMRGSLAQLVDAISYPERNWYPDLSQYRDQALAYQQSPWVRFAVDVACTVFATAEWEVLRRVGEELVPIKNHPIELLLDRPNRYHSSYEFMYSSCGFRFVNGNCYWFLSGAPGGQPNELYLLRPDRMRIVAGENSEQGLVKGYIYEVDGVEVPLDYEEVIHTRGWNPLDDYYGLSKQTAIAMAISTDNSAAKWNRNWFSKDNAQPSGIVSVKNMVSDSDFQRIKAEFLEKYGNSSRRLHFTRGGDLSFSQTSSTHRDMDFIQSRTFDKHTILSVYGILPGLVEPNSTEANATAAYDFVVDRTVWPVMVEFGKKLTADLAPFWGDDLVIRPKDIRRKDTTREREEVNVYGKYMQYNEVRQTYLNLKPVPDGDVPYDVYMEQQRVKHLPAPAPVEVTRPDVLGKPKQLTAGDTEGAYTDAPVQDDTIPVKSLAATLLSRAARQELSRFALFAHKRVGTGNADQIEGFVFHDTPLPLVIAAKALMDIAEDRSVASLLNDTSVETLSGAYGDMQDSMSVYLTGLRDRVINTLHSRTFSRLPRDPQQLRDMFGTMWWQQESDRLDSAIRPVVQDITEQAAVDSVERNRVRFGYGVDTVLLSAPSASYANSWSNQIASNFNSNTRAGVYALFNRWAGAEGATLSDLLSAVEQSPIFSDKRGTLFSTTEATRVIGIGRYLAGRALAKALNVPYAVTQKQVEGLYPAHDGCTCGLQVEIIFKDGQPVGVDQRWYTTSKNPCATCSSHNGLLLSEIAGAA